MSASDAAHDFWTEENDYHDLARQFEQNVERTHPDIVTSKRMCPCIKYCGYCGWASTSVTYYQHRGEGV